MQHRPENDTTGRLALVCVNYGSHELLSANLDPGLARAGIGVVVVDNLSTTAEREAITTLCAERGWELVAMPGNPGFGEGVNAGVRHAQALGYDCFCALNPDAVATVDVLLALRDRLVAQPRQLLSPVIVKPDGKPWFRGSMVDYRNGHTRGGWLDEDQHLKRWLTGACLCFTSTSFDELDGFSDGWFLYWEDVDISRRAAEAGMDLVLADDLTVVHDEGGTQERSDDRSFSATYYRWNTRNRLLFAARHLDRRGLLRWIATTPAESRQVVLRGGRRQFLQSADPLTATVGGSLAGLGLAARALVRPATRASTARPGRHAALGSVLVAHPSPDLYGSDRVMLSSVDALRAAGVEVTVALPGPGPLVAEIEARGAHVHFVEMPVLRKSALKPAGFVQLLATAARSLPSQLALVRSTGAEVVLVNTITIPMWSLVGRLARVPAIVHVHEAEAEASPVVNRVLNGPLVLADRLVANSAFTRDVIATSYPWLARRTTVVHNAVPSPVEPVVAPVGEPLRLLYVGRLSPRKGPDIAISALAELRRHGIDARLAVVGAVYPGYEWFEEKLRCQVAELGLHDHVEFAGFSADVWPALQAAQVVLVPSTGEESFGNTAVEAVLAARPLVVSRHSGLAEATSGFESVRQVPAGDAHAVAQAVVDLWTGYPEAAEAARRDAALARDRYGEGQYAQALTAVLEAAAGRRA